MSYRDWKTRGALLRVQDGKPLSENWRIRIENDSGFVPDYRPTWHQRLRCDREVDRRIQMIRHDYFLCGRAGACHVLERDEERKRLAPCQEYGGRPSRCAAI